MSSKNRKRKRCKRDCGRSVNPYSGLYDTCCKSCAIGDKSTNLINHTNICSARFEEEKKEKKRKPKKQTPRNRNSGSNSKQNKKQCSDYSPIEGKHWICAICNFHNKFSRQTCFMCSKPKPISSTKTNTKSMLGAKRKLSQIEPEQDDNKTEHKSDKANAKGIDKNKDDKEIEAKEEINKPKTFYNKCPMAGGLFHECNEKCAQLWGVQVPKNPYAKPPKKRLKMSKAKTKPVSWGCPLCTALNEINNIRCTVCGATRSANNSADYERVLLEQSNAYKDSRPPRKRLKMLSSNEKPIQTKSMQQLDAVSDDDDDVPTSNRKLKFDHLGDDNEDEDEDDDIIKEMKHNGISNAFVHNLNQRNKNELTKNDSIIAQQLQEAINSQLKNSGFTYLADDLDNMVTFNKEISAALNRDEYWEAYSSAFSAVPFADRGGGELDNLVHGFEFGRTAIKPSKPSTKLTKVKGKPVASGFSFGNNNSNGDEDEIDEDSVPRVDIRSEFRDAMRTGKIIKCRLVKRRQFDDDDLGDSHFRRCESQFMRSYAHGLQNNSSQQQRTLREVSYVINPDLINKFEDKKRKMSAQLGAGNLNCILAWHGTRSTNVNSIVENNFSISHLASNTGNRGCYGAGIYFSEFANISAAYGDGLLLCKIILGRSYKMTGAQVGCGLKQGYDSHLCAYNQNSKYGSEIVIFDVDQILPCYIVKY